MTSMFGLDFLAAAVLGAQALGGGLSALGARDQRKAIKSQQAQAGELQAMREDDLRRQHAQAQSSGQALYAALGLAPNVGTPLQNQQQGLANYEEDAFRLGLQGKLEQDQFKNASRQALYQGGTNVLQAGGGFGNSFLNANDRFKWF